MYVDWVRVWETGAARSGRVTQPRPRSPGRGRSRSATGGARGRPLRRGQPRTRPARRAAPGAAAAAPPSRLSCRGGSRGGERVAECTSSSSTVRCSCRPGSERRSCVQPGHPTSSSRRVRGVHRRRGPPPIYPGAHSRGAGKRGSGAVGTTGSARPCAGAAAGTSSTRPRTVAPTVTPKAAVAPDVVRQPAGEARAQGVARGRSRWRASSSPRRPGPAGTTRSASVKTAIM